MSRYCLFVVMMSFTAVAQPVKYVPDHNELKYTFGGHSPVLRIRPGSIVETWTEDCYDGSVTSPSDLPSKVAPIGRDNPQTGPFYIEGARPGDILAVHLIDIRPARDYAVSSIYPGFGALTGIGILMTTVREQVQHQDMSITCFTLVLNVKNF